jgi:hypothetical protein
MQTEIVAIFLALATSLILLEGRPAMALRPVQQRMRSRG